MTANDIREALRNRYFDHRRYAVAEEVGLTTGYSHRRLDMMVMDCYNSNGFRIDGFEIKISTSDLRNELRDPEKHIAFFDVIDYYNLAAPAGVVEPLMDVIPKKWGILIVNDDGSTRYKRRPLALEDKKADGAVPRGFLAAITRAIQARQPADTELEQAYQRGYQEAEENLKRQRDYLADRISREGDKLKAYDELCYRFRIYGDNVDEIMDEFEAFRKLDISTTKAYISTVVARLNAINKMLENRSVDQEAQDG